MERDEKGVPVGEGSAAGRLHVYIAGRVQGVNFRHATRNRALQLGVRGWVRNLMDGRVEALFEGEKATLESMLAWCRQGPPSAWVDAVEADWGSSRGEFTGFAIRD